MRRALPVVAIAAPLLAWSWLRLETGSDAGQAALAVGLALLPVLVPGRRLRAVAVVIAFLVLGAVAFDLGPALALPGRVAARFGSGFLEFYDFQVPVDPSAHPRMHGVLLMAVFAFTLVVALGAAACRPAVVVAALVVGVGWPGTLLPGHDLLRGGLLLAAILATTVLLRRVPVRGVGTALAAGAVVIAAALFAASSPAFAKRAIFDWQQWDLYTKPAKPVDVSFVWNSSYSGLTFHGKPTTVFRVKAGPQSHYWRSSVLSGVNDGRWQEELSPAYGDSTVLGEPGFVPARERIVANWEEQHVTTEALHDRRLPGGSAPVRFAPSSQIGQVEYDPRGVAYATKYLSRGDTYDVWAYSPSPRPAQLARSKPVYPNGASSYLEVQPGVFPRLFGQSGRNAYVRHLLTQDPRARRIRPYTGLYGIAERVAGGARSPYAAAVALERWFRSSGGFTYDQHPPAPPAGIPALEDFVTRTRRGYCQQFAGSMALMLRFLGIPSRVAVGFASGRYDRSHGEWVVSDRDAHMWVEVWFRGWGWLPFDPTPGLGGLAGQYSSSSPAFDAGAIAAVLAGRNGLDKFGPGLAGVLGLNGRSRVTSDVPRLARTPLARSGRSGQRRSWGFLQVIAFGLAGAVLFVAALKLAVRSLRFLNRDPRRLAAAGRRELRGYLLDQGLDVPASVTLRELAELVESEYQVTSAGFGLYASAARFGPREGSREAARGMRRELRAVRRGIRRELTGLERFRGLISLRSLGLA
ncbi:MAG: protein-glutamine gamma-glutamyltransferase [Gaiellaceae bacterium]|jgi:transglutaminase-like putative cysteine protease|nr:protein-glutamine gamma-glutamyltransferase [Gaiellaceae bacterium]